jgi:hypothetical protein
MPHPTWLPMVPHPTCLPLLDQLDPYIPRPRPRLRRRGDEEILYYECVHAGSVLGGREVDVVRGAVEGVGVS